jgi:hypothetical protein
MAKAAQWRNNKISCRRKVIIRQREPRRKAEEAAISEENNEMASAGECMKPVAAWRIGIRRGVSEAAAYRAQYESGKIS